LIGLLLLAASFGTPTLSADEVPRLLDGLRSDDPYVRTSAAQALGELGTVAEVAVPDLIRLFSDHRVGIPGAASFPVPNANVSVSGEASRAIAKIGRSAIPHLVRTLASRNKDVRAVSAATLETIGSTAKQAVPALIVACDDLEPTVRCEAAGALGAIRGDVSGSLDKLGELLHNDADETVRLSAVNAIQSLGPQPKSAVSTLVLAVEDKSPDVRAAVARALSEYGADASSAVAPLIEMLSDSESRWEWHTPDSAGVVPVYEDVVASLLKIVAASPDQITFINTALAGHANVEVQAGAALILSRMNNKEQTALQAAAGILRRDEGGIEKSLACIREFGADARAVVPSVIVVIKHPDRKLQMAAITTLGSVGGPEALSALLGIMINEEDVTVRASAAKAIGEIGPEAHAAVPVLMKAAVDTSEGRSFMLQKSAIEALGEIGVAATPAVPLLLNVVKVEKYDDWIHPAAAEALGKIAPSDTMVQTALRDAADSHYKVAYKLRAAVARALGKGEATAEPYIPWLIDVVNGPYESEDSRAAACETLGKIGVATQPVISALLAALEEERGHFNGEVRLAAADSLGNLRADAAIPLLERVSASDEEEEALRDTAVEASRHIKSSR